MRIIAKKLIDYKDKDIIKIITGMQVIIVKEEIDAIRQNHFFLFFGWFQSENDFLNYYDLSSLTC